MLKQSLSILTAGLVGALAISACGDSGADGGAGGQGGEAATTSTKATSAATKTTGAGPTTGAMNTSASTADASSSADASSADASTTSDATTATATVAASSSTGMLTPGADGNNCAMDATCDGGTCLTEVDNGIPGGQCTEDCGATGMCADANSTCVSFGIFGPNLCLRNCDPATAGSCGAPATLECLELNGGGGVCFGTCTADAQCSGGNVCDEAVGSCEGVENCTNMMDDNGDGETDCADGQCSADATCVAALAMACMNPPALTNGSTVMGTTVGGSNSFTCGSGVGGGLGRVYTYTATATGQVTFTLDSGMQDQGLIARSACSNNPADNLGCVDASGGAIENLTLAVTTGDVVTVVVEAFAPMEEGPFSLTTSFAAPPPNDTCAGALPLIGATMGTWAGATDGSSPGAAMNMCTGFTAEGGDVVYSFTLPANGTLDVTITPNGTSGDPSIYVVSDCNMTAATCVEGMDGGVGGDPETLTFTNMAGGNFFLIVDTFEPVSESFTIDATITP